MMRPTINEESDCLRKKNLRRRQSQRMFSALFILNLLNFNLEILSHAARNFGGLKRQGDCSSIQNYLTTIVLIVRDFCCAGKVQ
jgi:hypothetical protein